jgi:hypothetical protein
MDKKWCTLENGECIAKEFWCSRKGKFNVFTSFFIKFLDRDACSKEQLCAFENGECIPTEFWCSRKGKFFNVFTSFFNKIFRHRCML